MIELTDLVEVLYTILESKGVCVVEFEKVRLAKWEKCGGFKEKAFFDECRGMRGCTLKQY
jgi:predicted house-cleaning noncanonical NTP pyrophosphatase (MazG superfamily)